MKTSEWLKPKKENAEHIPQSMNDVQEKKSLKYLALMAVGAKRR